MRRMLPAAIVAVTLAAGGVSGITGGVSEVAAAESPGLQWTACATPGLQCATLSVPLDYNRPGGPKIQLAITKKASQHPEKRRGVMLLNPGGPGLPGTTAPLITPFPQDVQDTYDLIGFDPRGVGKSTPVTCNMTPQQRADSANPPYPHNSADVARTAKAARQVAEQCLHSKTASLLPYTTTANTARDMDQIRAALGATKISYYGDSYGTYLGAVYTTLYPQRSDRVVLDSALPPDGYSESALRAQAQGFETRFPDFATYLVEHSAEYHLGTTLAAVKAKYFALATRLDQKPLGENTGTAFRAMTSGLIRSDGTFEYLADYWQQMDTNNPPPDGPPAPTDTWPAGHFAVACGDSEWSHSLLTYQAHVAIDRIRYPMYGAETANVTLCAYWPAPAEPQVRLANHGQSVLILQNLRDPATPIAGARRTQAALGAHLVTVDQGGHVAYGAPNKCGNNAVNTYLLTGRSINKYCPAEPTP
ncbi:alpha/beta hydrolase [Kribbella sp. NPDC055071]